MSSLFSSIQSGQARENVEAAFGRWGNTVFSYAWLVIFLFVISLSTLYSYLPDLQVDTTMESFFYEDDPARVRYNEFRKQYGRDDTVMILVETEEVFTEAFLTKLKTFHEAIENNVPFVNEVRSLINARQTIGYEDTLEVSDFLEQIPSDPTALAALKQRALNNPVYIDNYISRSSKMTVIIVENENFRTSTSDADVMGGFDDSDSEFNSNNGDITYLTEADNTEIRMGFEQLEEQFESENFQIYIASGPYTTAWFLDTVKRNMQTFTGLAVLIVIVLLTALFRRLVIVVLPISVAILSMLAAMSVMAALGIRVSFSMQIVPPFLIAVGVGNSVHIFTVFFQAINRGCSKQEALSYALQHSGLAIVMTGFTTAGSLLSFLSSNMKPLVEFGIMTPMGVMFALLFSLVLLPALIAVSPIRLTSKPRQRSNFIRRLLIRGGLIAYNNPGRVLTVWLLLAVIALGLATQLRFSFLLYNNLPPDHFLLEASRKVDDNMAGTGPLELIIDSGKVDGIKDPVFLRKLEAIHQLSQNYVFKKAISVQDINKELHQALNANDPDFYRIPDDKALVAQELLLFENSGADDLEKMVDSQFRYARLTLLAPMQDAEQFTPVLKQFINEAREILGPQHAVHTTGIMDLSFNVFTEMHGTMAKSYLIAFTIITPLMIILIGSVRVGLVSMLPNLIPIIITLGVMGGAGIFLTGATLLTGSIAIGLVVDDTIHFMHNFQRYHARSGNVRLAIRQTLETTGQAIFITTMVLTSAFFIFIFHEVHEWAYFGFITGFCIAIALLADIFLAPALVTLLFKKKS